jgi:hypothetical protein
MHMQPVNFEQELEEIAGESIGWIPLEDRAYLHLGDADATVVMVTGVPDADMADMTVLLLV